MKILFLLCFTLTLYSAVNLVTDSSEVHIKPIITKFTYETGVEVNVLYMKKGIVDRSSMGEFDVVIANAVELDAMMDRGYLIKSNTKGVPTNGFYHITSGRTRGFFVKNGIIAPKTYNEALLYNTICSRKLTDEYNIEFFSTFIERYGLDYTRKYITSLKLRLKDQYGNDRIQVKRVHEGECQLSFGNSYYAEIMKRDPEQKNWLSDVTFEEPTNPVWLYRGVALLKKTNESEQFIKWFTSKETLKYIETVTFEKTTLPIKDLSELKRINSHRIEAYQLLQD